MSGDTTSKITIEDFEQRSGHHGCVVWLTGLSASGKSTVAEAIQRKLFARGMQVMILDGDSVRTGLNKDLGFSPKDREENIRRVGEVAKLFRLSGFIVLAALISPYQKDRSFVRSILEPGRFFEVHVAADLDTCVKRDPRGLYKKAMEGKIPEFTGISAPYEVPSNPELVLDTSNETVDQSAATVLNMLESAGIFHVPRC
jgi:adenylylsulfate kinase